jgi:hypothetical protein
VLKVCDFVEKKADLRYTQKVAEVKIFAGMV